MAGMVSQDFIIRISSTHPDASEIVRAATRKIASEIGWGDDEFASIEAEKIHADNTIEYLAGYEMEPGEAD